MAIKRTKRFVSDYKCENCGEVMLRTEEEGIGLTTPRDPETSRFFHLEKEFFYECPFCGAQHKLFRITETRLDIGPISSIS